MMIDHMQIQGCSANIVTLSDVRKSPMYPQKSRMYPQKSPMYQLIQTPSDVRMNQIKSCVRMGVSHVYEYNLYEYQIYMKTYVHMYVYACIIYLTNDDRSCSDTRICCEHYAESDFNLRIHMALLRIHKALLRRHRALLHSVTNDDIMQIQGYVAEIRARALYVCAYLT